MDRIFGVEFYVINCKIVKDKWFVLWYEELNMVFIWVFGIMGISCFVIGFLGWEFGLSLK